MAGGKPVTHSECKAHVNLVLTKMDTLHMDIKDIEVILRGTQGRNGVVRDVNYLMNQSKTVQMLTSTIVGIIAALVTNYIQHAFGG